MNIEDRLTAALRGTADLVEDRPRPLPTASRERALPRFMPAWTALVVALVVLAPFVLPDRGADAPVPASSPSFDTGTAPKTYVAVYRADEDEKSRFEIRSTATGEVLDVNDAGNGEDFVSIASIPDDGKEGVGSFFLLVRLGEGTRRGCTKYTIYSLQTSDEGRFSSWGTSSIVFEALDGTPANLAATPKGDAVAYSYEGCGHKMVEGDEEVRTGDGMPGETRIAHHWAGTTTSWGTDAAVRNLAYSSDGRTLAALLHDGKDGEPHSRQLRITEVGNPRSGFTDGTENDIAVETVDDFDLINAMPAPDGKKIVALWRNRSYAITEFPRFGGEPRTVGVLEPPTAPPAVRQVLMEQSPSGEALLFQVGDTTFLHMGQRSRAIAKGKAPSDLAW